MLNKYKAQKSKILISITVVFFLGWIRAFENVLFYDPFLAYFESDFNAIPLPEVEGFKLFWNLLLRYVLNTILSLVLIYILFRDNSILKFSLILYVFFLVFLFAMFFVIIGYFPDNSWLLFYVRRFIIQPIFVLLFIPAFYYQLQNIKK